MGSLSLRARGLLATVAVIGVAGGISLLAIAPSNAASDSSTSVTNGVSKIVYSASTSSDRYISYHNPSTSLIPQGRALFIENCSTCHGNNAQGGTRAPNLQGLGTATVDFWVYTGRMPLADSTVQAIQKPRRFNLTQTLAIAEYVNSLAPGGVAIPDVNLSAASLSTGQDLFSTNCASCHTITGAGDALANNVYAPSLSSVGATQIAEAIRTGPGNMPRFGTGTLSDFQVASLVKYVQYLQHPSDPGGLALGHVGPVTEGFVGILVGLGGIMLFGYWIGGRVSR